MDYIIGLIAVALGGAAIVGGIAVLFSKAKSVQDSFISLICGVAIICGGIIFIISGLDYFSDDTSSEGDYYQYNDSGSSYPSFGATNKGHCRNCGLDHYGHYKCPKFIPKKGDPTVCSYCGCPMSDHAKNN